MSTMLARELVMSYGWNATCYQILNPGIEHWFSSRIPAVVGYTRRLGVLLVAGAPVCAGERLPEVCAEFEDYARAQSCRVCYVCAAERLRTLFADSSEHSIVTLGAQPVWNPRDWPQLIEHHSSLRAQLNRCRNKDVIVEAAVPDEAASDPELRRVLQEWLSARSLPPLEFLVEPDVLDGVVSERRILVAKRNRIPIAYLVASPIAARQGYLVELVARSHTAPNGVSELLIDAAMQRFAVEDKLYATLGLVALASAAEPGIRDNPFWLRSLMRFARLHANRFYNFQGLEQFRVKMAPCDWEPIFAISNEQRFSALTLYGMGAAFSGISPWLAIGIGAMKAVREEIRRYR